MSEQVSFVVEHHDNQTLAEANDALATMVVQLQRENEELRRKYDNLRLNSKPTAQELHRVRMAWERDRERADKAESENAKLREFIDLRETCWKYIGWCDECPCNGMDDEHDDCNCTVQEKVSSLARELGVET